MDPLSSHREAEQAWRDKRIALAATHEDGASEALGDAIADNADVKCASYCYGGSPRIDIPEVLADLAEGGWRLVRTEP